MLNIEDLHRAVAEAGEVPCQNAPDLFIPEDDSRHLMNLAKKMCATCPVIDVCGEYALENYEPFGVWGGMTLTERRAMRRRLGLPAYATTLDELAS